MSTFIIRSGSGYLLKMELGQPLMTSDQRCALHMDEWKAKMTRSEIKHLGFDAEIIQL